MSEMLLRRPLIRKWLSVAAEIFAVVQTMITESEQHRDQHRLKEEVHYTLKVSFLKHILLCLQVILMGSSTHFLHPCLFTGLLHIEYFYCVVLTGPSIIFSHTLLKSKVRGARLSVFHINSIERTQYNVVYF